ncbi:MAG: phosphoribosylformylglycinamidine synthase subunit PurL [Actinobacteria bacterium]|nr:phosphoribosylformylglycinamidine synthase subunit PurL [Actinomycetota bacterium]
MWRVEVGYKSAENDSLGHAIKKEIIDDLHLKIDEARTFDVYTIKADLTEEQISIVTKDLLTDSVVQKRWVNDSGNFQIPFAVAIEVGYKKGVTDNVSRTTIEGIEDLLKIKFKETESVHTSKLYLLNGNISKTDAGKICTGLLANPLIEHFSIYDQSSFSSRCETSFNSSLTKGDTFNSPLNKGDTFNSPLTKGGRRGVTGEQGVSEQPDVVEINLNVSDEELIEISRKGILSLELTEMQKIREYYALSGIADERKQIGLGLNPTDVELEMLAQTWSEHCKHKIFNGLIEYSENGKTEVIDSLFKSYIKKATDEIGKKKNWLVSVFVDNAGIISFNENYNIVFKVETHNHPSALDPYGGAVTGIVGVNRDPMGTGLGANLIFNTDVFCFGPPDFPYEKLPLGILHPKRIFKGVRKGVEDGGNKIGIPTVNGAVLFDEAYVYNPLVYCGTGGIIPKKIAGRDSSLKTVNNSDLIVMVGGRIGKDGIHGATFSSTLLDEESSSSAVQIGAPIVQKKMMDALIEARDLGLYNAITDNGAGGLSSSVGEMAGFSGGCLVDLEKAPVKYAGLKPWELWVSEAQERMTLAVPEEKINQFLELCKHRDVEATVIGEFNNSGKVQVRYNGKMIASLDIEFLHGGLPGIKRKAVWKSPQFKKEKFDQPKDLTEELKKILSSLNVCSKEWIIRQYDHEVQGTSVLKPLVGINNDGPSDAAVIKPLFDSKKGLAVACGINPMYSGIDAYWMAASAVDEAVRNVVSVGGDFERIALLDNFCWGNPILSKDNPNGDYKMAQLVRAAKACYDIASVFETPFISGKDSFHNEYKVGDRVISIPPTLLISALGIVDDCEKVVSMDFKRSGDLIYLLGETRLELGGSHYYKINKKSNNNVPKVNLTLARKLYQALSKAINKGLVASCHDLSEGGLGVALAESAFAGGLGAVVNLKSVPFGGELREDEIIFSETNSRFIVTVNPEDKNLFEKIIKGNVFGLIGSVREDKKFKIIGLNDKEIVSSDIDDLKEAWQKTLRW